MQYCFAFEHNDVIVTLGLLRKQHEAQSGTILQTIFKDIFGKGDMIKNKFWNLLTFKNRIASAKLAAQRADWHIMKMITTTNKVTVVGLWYLCFWTSKQILRKSRKQFHTDSKHLSRDYVKILYWTFETLHWYSEIYFFGRWTEIWKCSLMWEEGKRCGPQYSQQ